MKTNTILLSIHCEHFNKIWNGEKEFEYRKKLPTNIKNVILYVTDPIFQVVCILEDIRIIQAKPDVIWYLTKEKSGISRDFFYKYFENKEIGYCFSWSELRSVVGEMRELSFYGVKRPPQNYCYVKDTLIDDFLTTKK